MLRYSVCMSRSETQDVEVLRELHHRVKNNLQVICSLLRLQAGYLTDETAREMFKCSEERVRSLALIHEELFGDSGLSSVQFDLYIVKLVGQLVKSYRVGVEMKDVEFQLESLCLPVDQAVPCGLLVNELVSNGLKYGHRRGAHPYLGVRLGRQAGSVVLEVADHGDGFSPEVDFAKPKTLGLRLVQSLAAQLGGSVSLDRHGRTAVRVAFKERPQSSQSNSSSPDRPSSITAAA